MLRRGRCVAVVVGFVLAAFLLEVGSAGAVWRGSAPGPPTDRAGTQLIMSGTGHGQAVRGFIADTSSTFDPVRDGYPASNPTADEGFTPLDEGFAGIINGRPTDGGAELKLYCIDILTATYGGIGYVLGTWNTANVPNVDYVARLLNEYYPNTDQPAALTDLNQRAAAVQAAVWFFTDRYVLNTSDPLRGEVVKIVDHIIAAGPVGEQPAPSLTITPSHVSGPAHKVLGPFTVTTNHPPAAVTATGGSMFSDAAGTVPIDQGATVPSGKKIWVRSTGPTIAVLEASSKATVPTGNVYLYDGFTSGVSDAQHLILAKEGTLKTTVTGTAEFLAPGSLVVKKTIAGPAAGSQARVVIEVDCDDGVTRPDFIIPAGAPAGTTSKTYEPIAVGTKCTVIETSNGSTVGTEVVVTGDGQDVTIPSGNHETVEITDTYTHVGSLIVRKTIAGPGAGQEGEIRIHSVCDGTALTPDFVIPAGTPAGDQTRQYDHIRVPATCTVTETVDGHTSTVSVDVEGSGQTVSVPAGDVVEADISDTYGLLPGELEVTKSIAGPLAGHQGMVVIHTVCNGTALTPDFVIPAGAVGDHSHIYSPVPTPASCVVTETMNGATSAVSAVVIGSPHTVTIPAGGSGAAHFTDTYGPAPGSLLVTKTIAGSRAGQQGPVTIHVACDGTGLSPDFEIASHTPAGSVSHSFDDIPAGSVCTVTETADGATATVTATVDGNGQKVTIPAGKVVPVNLMDVYLGAPGTLKVTKTIAGRAARRHGPIAILVACGGPLHAYAFHIPAHATGSKSRYFSSIPAGSRCTVSETANGHTHRVRVVATTKHKKTTISPNRTATTHLTDTFSRRRPPRPPPIGLG